MTSHTWVATTDGKHRKRGSSALPMAEEWREVEEAAEASVAEGVEEGEWGMKEARWGVEGLFPRRERETQLGRPKREWSTSRTSVRAREGRWTEWMTALSLCTRRKVRSEREGR
jgi:hypothetical protein